MRPIAKWFDRRHAAPAQRDGLALMLDRNPGCVYDVNLAAHQQRSVGAGDDDRRRIRAFWLDHGRRPSGDAKSTAAIV